MSVTGTLADAGQIANPTLVGLIADAFGIATRGSCRPSY
jgi:hypothetical protein